MSGVDCVVRGQSAYTGE